MRLVWAARSVVLDGGWARDRESIGELLGAQKHQLFLIKKSDFF
jgi:hypothetical protein